MGFGSFKDFLDFSFILCILAILGDDLGALQMPIIKTVGIRPNAVAVIQRHTEQSATRTPMAGPNN